MGGAALLLAFERLRSGTVAPHSRGVAEAAANEHRVAFGCLQQSLFQVRMQRRLTRQQKARSHVDAFGTQREGCDRVPCRRRTRRMP